MENEVFKWMYSTGEMYYVVSGQYTSRNLLEMRAETLTVGRALPDPLRIVNATVLLVHTHPSMSVNWLLAMLSSDKDRYKPCHFIVPWRSCTPNAVGSGLRKASKMLCKKIGWKRPET